VQARRGKLQQSASFFAGAAVATIASDAILIALAAHPAPARGLVHHVEFLAILISLVGLAGVMALQMPHRRELPPAALVGLGALAAVLGYAIGLMLAPALGATASIIAIVVAAAAVPTAAGHWPRRRG
jgi:FtsH-binding integral membrane protein